MPLLVLFIRDLGCSYATGHSGMPSIVLLSNTWSFNLQGPAQNPTLCIWCSWNPAGLTVPCVWLCVHIHSSAVSVTFLSYPYVSLLMACLYCFESLYHHELGKGLNKYCWLIEAMIKHEQYLILKSIHLRIFHIPFPPYSPIANWEARWINTKISEPRNQFNFTVSKHGNPPSSTHGSCYVCKWEGSAVKIQPLE